MSGNQENQDELSTNSVGEDYAMESSVEIDEADSFDPAETSDTVSTLDDLEKQIQVLCSYTDTQPSYSYATASALLSVRDRQCSYLEEEIAMLIERKEARSQKIKKNKAELKMKLTSMKGFYQSIIQSSVNAQNSLDKFVNSLTELKQKMNNDKNNLVNIKQKLKHEKDWSGELNVMTAKLEKAQRENAVIRQMKEKLETDEVQVIQINQDAKNRLIILKSKSEQLEAKFNHVKVLFAKHRNAEKTANEKLQKEITAYKQLKNHAATQLRPLQLENKSLKVLKNELLEKLNKMQGDSKKLFGEIKNMKSALHKHHEELNNHKNDNHTLKRQLTGSKQLFEKLQKSNNELINRTKAIEDKNMKQIECLQQQILSNAKRQQKTENPANLTQNPKTKNQRRKFFTEGGLLPGASSTGQEQVGESSREKSTNQVHPQQIFDSSEDNFLEGMSNILLELSDQSSESDMSTFNIPKRPKHK